MAAIGFAAAAAHYFAYRSRAFLFAQREAKFRLLFENNPLAMWVYDLQTLHFLEVNDAAVARYGYSRDEFLGLRITDIRPAEDIPLLTENLTHSFRPTDRTRGAMAAPAWGCRSARGWWASWAAACGWRAKRGKEARSILR